MDETEREVDGEVEHADVLDYGGRGTLVLKLEGKGFFAFEHDDINRLKAYAEGFTAGMAGRLVRIGYRDAGGYRAITRLWREEINTECAPISLRDPFSTEAGKRRMAFGFGFMVAGTLEWFLYLANTASPSLGAMALLFAIIGFFIAVTASTVSSLGESKGG